MIPFYMENKQDKSDYAKALAELKWLFEICPGETDRPKNVTYLNDYRRKTQTNANTY